MSFWSDAHESRAHHESSKQSALQSSIANANAAIRTELSRLEDTLLSEILAVAKKSFVETGVIGEIVVDYRTTLEHSFGRCDEATIEGFVQKKAKSAFMRAVKELGGTNHLSTYRRKPRGVGLGEEMPGGYKITVPRCSHAYDYDLENHLLPFEIWVLIVCKFTPPLR